MDTKLTLKLEHSIIEKAKKYARLHNTSLSGLIENYLQKITNDNEEKGQLTPLVKGLSGIIDLQEGFDYKNDYRDSLVNKYK
jgi:hypothetical protein